MTVGRVGRGALSKGAVVLENDTTSVTVVPDHGGAITSFVARPYNVDVLWKALAPTCELLDAGEASEREWHRSYRGGWHTILPNFGPANTHQGVHHQLHGEAARAAWTVEGTGSDRDGAAVVLSVGLAATTLQVRRIVRLRAEQPVLTVTETVTNVGDVAVECMWGHHPVFGAPFVSPACVVDTGARTVEVDPAYPRSDLVPGRRAAWPVVGGCNLSRMPEPGASCSRVVTLLDFDEHWYAITNRDLGVGVGVAWSGDEFPYACMWQEATDRYALAIEPQSSYPGHGVSAVAASTGTQIHLDPGERRTGEVTAVWYEAQAGVRRVGLEGEVERR